MRLVLLVLLLCFGTATAALADPFGRPAGADPAPAAEPAASGPSMLGGFVQRLAREQSKINDKISDEIRTVRDTGSMTAMLTILSIAFLWGVLHAAGPGHGKTLVAAYFATTEARWTSGIIMGGVISLLQGLTAIIVVFILAAVLHELQQEVRLRGAAIELVSYGLVAALGLVMLWRAVTGQGHNHHHGPIGASHEAHDHDHAHCHGHDHHHDGHHAAPSVAAGRRKMSFGSILTVFAGIAPCASAIIIMLFSLANDAILIGAVAVLALSLGMGLTVSAIGVLSIVARKFMRRFATGSGERGERLERLLAIAGAIAVIGFSGLLALGAWDQMSAPI
jgi:nickel/cobalt transporter (NicO) family protein